MHINDEVARQSGTWKSQMSGPGQMSKCRLMWPLPSLFTSKALGHWEDPTGILLGPGPYLGGTQNLLGQAQAGVDNADQVSCTAAAVLSGTESSSSCSSNPRPEHHNLHCIKWLHWLSGSGPGLSSTGCQIKMWGSLSQSWGKSS